MAENEKSKNGYGVLIVAVATVIVLWSLNWILLWKYGGNDTEKGQFGDMFGAINSLFSGLAFAFLIYTALLQKKELELQRKEFEKSVEEQKRQADALAKTTELQAKTFELQIQQLKLTERKFEEEQIRIEEENDPRFIGQGIQCNFMSGTSQIVLPITNMGQTALEVSFKSREKLQNNGTLYNSFTKGHSMNLSWVFETMEEIPSTIPLEISFQNLKGVRKTIFASIIRDENATSVEKMFAFKYNQ